MIIRLVDILPIRTDVNPPTSANPVATLADISAAQASYVAASAVDWNGAPPATVKAALDRIAAKITPIP